MLEKSSLRKIVSTLSVITVFLALGVGILTWLLLQKQKELTQNVASSVSQEEDQKLRAEYKDILDSTKADREKLAAYVVRSDADTAHLLEKIETFATSSNLTLAENVNTEKTSDTAQSLILTIEVKGNFNDVMSFLSSLEALPYETLFRAVDIRRGSELAQKNAQWTMNVSLAIKSFKP